MADKPKKLRAEFRKNRVPRTRKRNLTETFRREGAAEEDAASGERISGKGELTRKRTVWTSADSDTSQASPQLDVADANCLEGRVLCGSGLVSTVMGPDGTIFQCATRRILKTLSTDQRHVVATGDRVQFSPQGNQEGWIERIEPRYGVLARTSYGKKQVIVANVDLVLIITSTAEPEIKPHLIDRMLVTAEHARIQPIICVNKMDLVPAEDFQPLFGSYGQMGYTILPLSTVTGAGIERLRAIVHGKQSVVTGQSGVGKSSLLNALQPGLDLRVRAVSEENQKGRHTTTSSVLVPLEDGGWIVDTPGIRQFQLWDIVPQEVAGYFRDLRPYVSLCRFPDCSHIHESDCAVKDAVADHRIDIRRYESFCHMFSEPDQGSGPS